MIGLSEIEQAGRRIVGHARWTPLVAAEHLSRPAWRCAQGNALSARKANAATRRQRVGARRANTATRR